MGSTKTRCVLLALALLIIVSQNEASKILGIFAMPSKSHTILGTALFKELARRGHQVTMLSPFKMDNLPENYTEIFWDYRDENSDVGNKYVSAKTSGFARLNMALHGISSFLDRVHGNQNIKKFLDTNEKFDLCIYSLGLTDSFLGICNHFNATTIGFNTVGLNPFIAHMMSNPTPYSFVPHLYVPFNDKMTFFQRVGNTIAWTGFDLLLSLFNKPLQQQMLSKHYPTAPPLDELIENVDLILANSNYATDTLVPLQPNIIPIGGFHLEEETEISNNLQSYLDNSTTGVVYFNLGSNAKSKFMQPEILQHFLNTFSKLPYDVLWKFEEEMSGKPSNVRLEKWLPQRNILTHPNVKLFITHGGNGGMIETIYGGVPMICMPHFGDQLKNCAGSVANGYAIELDVNTLTEEILTTSIQEMLDNPKYKEAIMLKSDVFKNQAISPMNRAIFWIEHVIKHKGAKHLKTQASKLPWYKRNLVDVGAFLLAVISICFCIMFYLTRLIWKFLRYMIRKWNLNNVKCPKIKSN